MSNNKGRHRSATRTNRVVAGATVMGIGLSLPVMLSGNAQAADNSTWDKVAKCESSGNWSINTGLYDGGLQFLDSTWDAYKPAGYPASANQATKAQQIAVAEKVLAAQGDEAWPVCGDKAGLSKNDATPNSAPPVTTKSVPKVTPKAASTTYKADKAVAFVKAQVGDSYVYGGNGPNAWDCSGLTQAAWKAAGITLPRTAAEQWKSMSKVSLNSLKPGDLIVFYAGASHIGMYIGDGKFVHAPNKHRTVSVDTLKGYYRSNAIGAVRPTPYVATNAPTPKPEPRPKPTKPVETSGEYKVKSGDTLSGISRTELHTTNWKPLYEANRKTVGADPDLIFPGQKLDMPTTNLKKLAVEEPAEKKVVTEAAPTVSVSPPLANPHVIQSYHNAGAYTLGYHTGTDFAARTGTPVKAVAAGTVVASDRSSSYGTNVLIKHDDGTYSLYAHLSSKTVFPGAKVPAGRMVGLSGSSGNSTGPHLHLEIRTEASFGAGNFLDPIKWLRDKGLSI